MSNQQQPPLDFTATWDQVQFGIIDGEPICLCNFDSPQDLRNWVMFNIRTVVGILDALDKFARAGEAIGYNLPSVHFTHPQPRPRGTDK